MNSNERIVVQLGHSADDTTSVRERIRRYRAIAGTSNSPAIAEHFFECADDLEAAEQKIGQRVFRFPARPKA